MQLRRFAEPWAAQKLPLDKMVDNIVNSIDLARELIKRFDNADVPVEEIERLVVQRHFMAHIPEAAQTAFAELKEQHEEAKQRRYEQFSSVKDKDDVVTRGADEDQDYSAFRDVSVYPSTEEMIDEDAPATPKNLITGPYASVDHYLHTHFHLLRDDCMIPLRDGIHSYLGGTLTLHVCL
jgi:DNA-binding transcriptional MerR regulator